MRLYSFPYICDKKIRQIVWWCDLTENSSWLTELSKRKKKIQILVSKK